MVGIINVFSDNNIGDFAIVMTRIKLESKKIKLFSVYNSFQGKFTTQHRKFSNFQIHSNPYGELGIDFENKLIRYFSKVFHFGILIFRFILEFYFYKVFNLKTSFIKQLEICDKVYYKGGSVFESNGTIANIISLIRSYFLIKIISSTGAYIIFDPQSYGPFRGVLSHIYFSKIINKADEIHCREAISYRYINMYFPTLNTILSPDIVFKYPLKKFKIKKTNSLGLTLVSTDRLNNDLYISVIKKLIILYLDLLKINHVTIIRQVDLSDFDGKEIKLEDYFISFLRSKKIGFTVIKNIDSVESAVKIYSQLDFLIATRLHSSILAFLASTPFLCIEYQGFKARGTFQLLGFPLRVFKLQNLSTKFNNEKAIFESLIQNSDITNYLIANEKI